MTVDTRNTYCSLTGYTNTNSLHLLLSVHPLHLKMKKWLLPTCTACTNKLIDKPIN